MKVNVYDLLVKESNRIPYLQKVKSTSCTDTISLNDPSKVVETLNRIFHANKLLEEHVYMIALDNHLQPVGFFDSSHGTENQSAISTAALLRRALLCGAVYMIVAHNHPSGDPEPSEEDRDFTEHLLEGCKYCGISFCDHVIIGGAGRHDRYYSFRNNDLI